ncbi:adenylyl-sulfate kinase [Gilliamella sp. B2776]|uniref:gluconokinase, GntK/IdnK-type n=1 Tax=unclassified Gilliamella TaxID=2685620 RepID=UPI0027A6549D|nr:adenylyl-sulfate kinase [Gilliamella sp. B2779]MCX8653677.1 adenylyl-sulfate kinase [Gilliamella sp. B2737]MCX8656132.1 adenylyl-sulfate kinase [Gilliamella sp. B2894]MCX8664560.1 adenylyl-sulfate kinase [Gilliamella sp. B2887]MCX8691585.1 adenylyl-sulfate kinase [Gilliamella sp. B2776]MCX8693363.1 adenylyl-sulfate kinase [Gilliamella sp. B2881]MCX8695775.1 adenylyl-sulfate kinase [Gilliamella sp. B2828]MCX8698407.1 adenylyl-sulfate kinase [Gilliamella sp. B3000]MCX8700201.1 adenylyl-sul
MGVSGSGKSAVAKQVSYNLDAAFLDGDFLHPKANILKMRSGTPLNDEDRFPWLDLISNAAFAMSNINNISIIICSALKRKYRDIIRGKNENVHFIYLKGSYDVIADRLAKRKDHYQKTGMLQSQFDTLEEPTVDEKDVYTVNIEQSLEGVVHDTQQLISTTCQRKK